MTKDVVRSSLAIDEAMLSKMLGVVDVVPAPVIKALGASKKIGRDKWLSLRPSEDRHGLCGNGRVSDA